MASELRVNTLKDAAGNNSVGMTYVANGSAKAWAAYDMTGTANIKDSINISSLSDNDTGECQIFYSNSFSNVNYAAATCAGGTAISDSALVALSALDASTPRTTGLIRLGYAYVNASVNRTKYDVAFNDVTFHGDLA